MLLIKNIRKMILPIENINHNLPNVGLIYEIGCGTGALAEEIARYSDKRRVIGIDKNAYKIKQAQKNLRLKNLKYVVEDIFKFQMHSCVGIIMSDFLHHLSYTQQEILVRKIAKLLPKNNNLLIKEIDASDGWRTFLSRIWDGLLYPGDSICYRSQKQWIKLFTHNGFNVAVKRTNHLFPGSTWFYICTKK